MDLSPKFEEALVYATRLHGGQLRKKTKIPYIGHLLGVTAIALEYGANETEAIAALLHDAVEDCGGPQRQREIEELFGKEVGAIVAGCTDTDPGNPRLSMHISVSSGPAGTLRYQT